MRDECFDGAAIGAQIERNGYARTGRLLTGTECASLVELYDDERLFRSETRRFPAGLESFLDQCAAAGQRQPTPLLLRYEAGGYNCLHQDLYGTVAFPLQVAVMLTEPGRDYEGGEFLLVEQRPRAQSAGEAILAAQGEMVVFPHRLRPVKGARGYYRVNVRHGVSHVRAGRRLALGLIFHDAC